ncbi:glycosyltransferase [Aeromicrobium sp.]|uniref:glycosyltransferase n=1 Tax=Aeromicrobium sp. TaxID=1871063 RepID=UPI0028A98729|nr:glycosyltransferase [Aeromicrobium sp.]
MGAAIAQYADRMPEYDHLLVYAERAESPIEPAWLERFIAAEPMRTGHVSRILQIARFRSRHRPQVIHLHSSFAGVYGRLAVSRRRARIVFTPHCYAFERLDLSAGVRGAVRLIEKGLSLNTSVVAACSKHESELAEDLGFKTHAVHVPSIVSPLDRVLPENPPVVAASGRLSPQKDPAYFLEIARRFRREHPRSDARFEWIGNTDPAWDRAFADAEVSVTGWLPREEARDRLARASVYVHCALWEGFPVSILDAVDSGVPLAVRDLPYALSVPRDSLFSDPEEAVALIARQLAEPEDQRSSVPWKEFLVAHSAERQRQGLEVAYGPMGTPS